MFLVAIPKVIKVSNWAPFTHVVNVIATTLKKRQEYEISCQLLSMLSVENLKMCTIQAIFLEKSNYRTQDMYFLSCSRYHVCLARKRSSVRNRADTPFALSEHRFDIQGIVGVCDMNFRINMIF